MPRDPVGRRGGEGSRRRQWALTRGCGGPVAVRWGGLVDRERPGQWQAKTCQQEWAEGLHGKPGRGRTGSGDAPSPEVVTHHVADMGWQWGTLGALLGPCKCGRGVPTPRWAQPALSGRARQALDSRKRPQALKVPATQLISLCVCVPVQGDRTVAVGWRGGKRGPGGARQEKL